jgi:uncharacterized protein
MTAYLCDVNIWLALAISGHVHHEPGRRWFDAIDIPDTVGFCRATQQGFLRLLTNAAVLAPYGNPPLTNKEAWAVYEALVRDERVALHEEPPGLEARWKTLATRGEAATKLWMDAYLAAFALTGRYRLATNDTAFRQFKGLDLIVLPA